MLDTRILKVYLSGRCVVLFDDGEHFHPPGCVESESKKDDGNHDEHSSVQPLEKSYHRQKLFLGKGRRKATRESSLGSSWWRSLLML